MRVRLAKKAELETVLTLQLQILPSDEPWPVESAVWWLAFDDIGKVIGFAGLSQSARWSDAMYLCRSGVIESARGKGVQRRLIQVRERWARRNGRRWLITDTHSNPASANSLIKRGFAMYIPRRPWAGDTACYWRKDLHK